MTKTKRLRDLLAADGILVSPGVYDGYSVRLVEQMGFKTACTTGAGMANSRLGVPDVGIMGLSDNVEACRMIARSVDIPVMADADTGYGSPVTVFHTARYFEESGVAGINIEDQVNPKRCGHMQGKEVIDAREMARKVEAACDARRDDDFVILARTDAIAVEGLEGAIRRAKLYAKAGADLIFADAIATEDQIKQLVDSVDVPVSVNMGFGIRARPTTPLISVKRLAELGVKRVTLPRMLPAAAIMAMKQALQIFQDAAQAGETVDRRDLLVGIDDIWELIGQPQVKELEKRYMTLEGIG
ncbi:isocitrate lyase/PEP mutase family protein [Limibacillus halophilus]|uniref:2-methylisocitrate lyase-like PEP mutase family enzyme n=1 Tax=Limibacillus halophilus TaxID=1579333 RepID=A0A839SVR2_9PROT|nr:isocitrate lyase/PEP mutase family protein [Limibacillus halophilus]MBB3066129.1 2-methylisocitrate lyase-like PEP mutase family enzyme [Limibacillus halophilus]